MATLVLLLKLFPVILSTVQAVEAAIPLPTAGKAKLDLVLGTVSDVYLAGQQLSSPHAGQDISIDHLLALVAQTIGRIVTTLNALGIFKKSS